MKESATAGGGQVQPRLGPPNPVMAPSMRMVVYYRYSAACMAVRLLQAGGRGCTSDQPGRMRDAVSGTAWRDVHVPTIDFVFLTQSAETAAGHITTAGANTNVFLTDHFPVALTFDVVRRLRAKISKPDTRRFLTIDICDDENHVIAPTAVLHLKPVRGARSRKGAPLVRTEVMHVVDLHIALPGTYFFRFSMQGSRTWREPFYVVQQHATLPS